MTASKAPAAAASRIAIGNGLTVNRLGFGAMRLTGPGVWGEPRDLEGSRRVLRRALELGIDFIDTADSYGPDVNERLIAATLRPYPAGLVIATKGGQVRPGPGQWEPDGRPEHLRAALEGSLGRLGVERVDLYQLHRPDPEVPFEESVGTLADLRNEGKIRLIGLSNVTTEQLTAALAMTPIASVQNRYSLFDRDSEDVLRLCTELGLAFIPWRPLGSEPAAAGAIDEVAKERGATPTQIALVWLLARSPRMLPIPGTSSVAHLEENVAAAAIELSPDDVRRLTPDPG